MNKDKKTSMEYKGLWLPSWMLRSERLTISEKMVLMEVVYLSELGNDGCYAKNGHFAFLLNKTKKSISNTIQTLQKKGFIFLVNEPGSRNHFRKIFVDYVVFENEKEKVLSKYPQNMEKDNIDDRPEAPCTADIHGILEDSSNPHNMEIVEEAVEIGEESTEYGTPSIKNGHVSTKSGKVSTKSGKVSMKYGETIESNQNNQSNQLIDNSKENSIGNFSKDVISILNNEAGTNYRSSSSVTKRLIKSRINDGFTVDDFRKVIMVKTAEWKHTDMATYLRPQTLFGPKFEAYLNAPVSSTVKSKVMQSHSELSAMDIINLELGEQEI